MTGWTQKEAVGRKLDEVFHIVNEHTRERCENPVEKVLETGGVVLVFRDITENIKLEAELRHAHKMEAIGNLAGGIAHEFNNVLGIIIGNAEPALGDLEAWHPVSENLNEIKTASLRAKEKGVGGARRDLCSYPHCHDAGGPGASSKEGQWIRRSFCRTPCRGVVGPQRRRGAALPSSPGRSGRMRIRARVCEMPGVKGGP